MAGGAVREERIDLLHTHRQEEGACHQAAVAADGALSVCGHMHAPPCTTNEWSRGRTRSQSLDRQQDGVVAAHHRAAATVTATNCRWMWANPKCGGVPATAGKEITTKLPDAAARCEAGAVHQGKRVLIAADNELQLDGGRAMKGHGSAGAGDSETWRGPSGDPGRAVGECTGMRLRI